MAIDSTTIIRKRPYHEEYTCQMNIKVDQSIADSLHQISLLEGVTKQDLVCNLLSEFELDYYRRRRRSDKK